MSDRKPTPAELLKRAKEQKERELRAQSSPSMMPSSSSSQVIPFSSSSAVPPVSSSSSDYGPNTTDTIKSSSTAPEEKKKTDTPQAPKAPPRKSADGGKKDGTKKNPDAGLDIFAGYTPPKREDTSNSDTEPREDYNLNWVDPASTRPTAPVNDEHRTVLQAMMGWDDVPYGRRWNHFIEHGFTGMHGEPFKELMQLVNAENQAGTGNGSTTYGQELRAKEQHRKSIIGQWDKLLSEWNSGRYASGDAYTVNEFFREAERLRNEYANAGYNPNELRRPSINAGGFQQGFQKSLQDDRTKLDWLGGWLNDIQQNIAKNPNWLNDPQAQLYFDKLSEYVILNMAQSRGAIADAEKVRAQVEAMPRADRLVYDRFMNMYFNANLVAQMEALAREGDYNAKAYLEDMDNFIGLTDQGKGAYGTIDENGEIILSDRAQHYLNAASLAVRAAMGDSNTPLEVNSAITSYDNAKDAFQNYVMQNANVDRKMVWDTALAQYGIYLDQFNRKLPELGLLWGWQHKGPALDQTLGDKLGKWQSMQGVSDVMQNAMLGIGHIPKPIDDPTGKRGGKGGGAVSKNSNIPKNAVWDPVRKKYRWKQNGQWRFSK